MRKLLATAGILTAAATFALAEPQTTFAPHDAADASRVAFQDVNEAPCPRDQEVLACVVRLGPSAIDRWAYLLSDPSGRDSEFVHAPDHAAGASCQAMAYPLGEVKIVGGSGDWFTGRIEWACHR